MSYATDVKQTLCASEPQKNCCRKAYLNGFLITSATHEEKHVTVRLSGVECRQVFMGLLDKVLHTEGQMRACRGGGETYDITFVSSSAARYLNEIDENSSIKEASLRCEECKKWFLRGIFLSSASLTDPAKAFRLDLTPRCHLLKIAEYLASLGLAPLLSERRGKQILFYRKGEVIGDFFGMMGEMDVYFALQDEFFKRELGNLTNRQNNCTFGNLLRSVESSGELLDLLNRMKAKGLLSLLPDDLKITAELRLAYPEYTLTRLAAASVPPLTKSGLNHRLNRILEFARKLDLKA